MKWLLTGSGLNDGLARYVSWILPAGALADLATPATGGPWAPEKYAALLLTGGGDAQPGRYGAALHPETRDIRRERDELELSLIREFHEAGVPIFGICRGLQMIQIAFGGALIQHVPERRAAAGRPEEHARGPDGADARHGLVWEPGTRLAAALGAWTDVNSSHHQAADPDRLGRGLRIAARSPAGVVEALEQEAARAPIVSAVQWHPERDRPGAGRAVLEYWETLARGRSRDPM